MAYSFTTSGSTPNSFLKGFNQNAGKNPFLSGSGTTPQAKALSTAQGGQSSVQGTPQAPFPKAETPVKKTTQTNTDGSTSTVEYHAPTEKPNAGMTTPSGLPITGNPATYSGVIPTTQDNQSTPTPQNQTQPTTFPGILGGLTNTSVNRNKELADRAQGIADTYGREYADIGGKGARAEAGYLTTGTTPVAEGNAAVIANTTAAQQAALAEGGQLALSGIDKGLTAQNQTQSALSSAGGLAQPSGNYPFVFDPLTGGFKNASGGGVLTPQDAAKAVMSGQMSYEQAKSSLGYLGQTGEAQLNSAVTSAGGNPLQLQASGSATQSNIETAGTAGTTAAQGVFTKAYGDYTTLQNAVQNVDQFGSLLTQNMGGINPSDVKYANKTIAQIRSQLSSAQQAQFDSTLAALTSKVSGLLSVGGNEIPTDISSAANKIIDGSLPIGSLTSVLQRIQAEGNILLGNQANIVNDAYGKIQAGGTGTNTSSSSSSNNSGSITWDNVAD